ncbi:MAG: hypothetical protein EXR21_09135, partial [Flavobacteriaceae bacterium]|nr:hypothetical protein [Flavobacteriaceae bacterium]
MNNNILDNTIEFVTSGSQQTGVEYFNTTHFNTDGDPSVWLKPGGNKAAIVKMQQALNDAYGNSLETKSGIWGPKTTVALEDIGLDGDGISQSEYNKLLMGYVFVKPGFGKVSTGNLEQTYEKLPEADKKELKKKGINNAKQFVANGKQWIADQGGLEAVLEKGKGWFDMFRGLVNSGKNVGKFAKDPTINWTDDKGNTITGTQTEYDIYLERKKEEDDKKNKIAG